MIFLSLHGFLLFRINRYQSVKALVTESYLTLCNPMDCRPPGSSVHGIVQARILEWIAISFSRGSSRPRYQTWVSRTAGRLFTVLAHQGGCLVMVHLHMMQVTREARNAPTESRSKCQSRGGTP